VRLLIDMNLSPEWVTVLGNADMDAVHWSTVGVDSANDHAICEYARSNALVILTQDLDFSQILFQSAESGPSVALLRIHNELDPIEQARVVSILQKCRSELTSGALLVIDGSRARIRPLPIR
jgi:predicted nuclease of predicted toxin-antitoxin system